MLGRHAELGDVRPVGEAKGLYLASELGIQPPGSACPGLLERVVLWIHNYVEAQDCLEERRGDEGDALAGVAGQMERDRG
jgi:hypothetical protein